MDLQKLYGPALTIIRETDDTPELQVRMNSDSDILYILTMSPEPKMEVAFGPSGVVILDEKRDPVDQEVVRESLTIQPKPIYKYEYQNSSTKPHSASFEYREGEIDFGYRKLLKDIYQCVDYNEYIVAEVDIAKEMIRQGIPEAIRLQSNFK